jgi:hypothetical protein
MASEFLVRGANLNEDLQRIVSAVHDHFDTSTKHLHFKLTDRRSLTANSQVWVWANQISNQTGEDVKTVFARMKRDQGLPILLADAEHGAVTDYLLTQTNFYKLRDDKQLVLVDAMEVTRKFSTRQHNDFRDNVQSFYNNHGFNLRYMEKDDDTSKK